MYDLMGTMPKVLTSEPLYDPSSLGQDISPGSRFPVLLSLAKVSGVCSSFEGCNMMAELKAVI